MYAVAKVGSLISQGVYSVATPFHPFGGAVDIIVVQQQDGSFRSTPWYVRFGKFQGVLKGAEKIVRIHVNGAEANFHMYLDNSGGAYFIREAESGLDSEPRVGGDGVVVQGDSRIDEGIIQKFSPHMLQSTLSDPGVWREDYAASLTSDGLDRSESDTCKFYDFQDEPSSLEVEGSVEFSSEYGSSRYDNSDIVENFVDAQGLGSEMVLVSVDGHILTAPISSIEKQATDNVELSTPQFHLGPGESAEFCEGDADFCISENAWAARSLTDLIATSSSKVKAGDGLGPDNSNALEHQPGVGNDEVDICQEQTTNDAQYLPKHKEDEESKHQEQGSNNGPRDVEIHEDGGECIHQNQRAINVENLDRDLHVCSDDEDESAGDKTLDKFKSCLKLKDLDQFSDHELQGGQEFPSSIKEESKTPHETCQKDLELSNGTEAGNSCSLQAADSGVEQRVDEFRLNEEPKIPICNLSLPPSADIGDQEDKKIATGARISDSDGKYVGDDSVSEGDQAKVAQLDGAMQSISDINDLEGGCCPSAIVEPKADCGEREQTFSSSRFEISLCRHLLRPDMGWTAAAEAFDAHHISREEFKSSATSIIKNEKLIVRLGDKYLAWDKAAPIVLGMAAFDLDLPVEPTDAIPVQQKEKMDESDSGGASTSGRKWKLWPIPFRRTKTLEHSISNSTNEEAFLDPKTPSQEQSAERTPTSQSGTPSFDISSKSPHKKVVRTNIPNSEQIAYLNLKDGQNIVTFSFFTRVLGLQQVEAHIHLWKWNARIVISDVDGTITKSDVLGQFMPLVGRDWSQSGVARLFSAIKENGYQLLFLSARAIVQAYLTKSFLFNLKQDGKTLPSGPVVISPDGLFPSLYREVIRRAPHEFKIACLEDIKALFPPDYNPFYAGFGNRDTDELSYRKIGIPKGKIFIINPKGEVAINNRIDLRSYTSLHTLVNDMFPPTSMVEQEDYNAWNYWKMPLLDIDE